MSNIPLPVFSDGVCHGGLCCLEVSVGRGEAERSDDDCDAQQHLVGGKSSYQDAAKVCNQCSNWIEEKEGAIASWNRGHGIHDGSAEHPDLQQERQRHPNVT